jgi:hypothetical protein
MYKKSGKFPGNIERAIKITDRDIYKYYPLKPKISKQQIITNQSTTKLPTLAYYTDGQAARQKCFYLHRAWQFLIQANSCSSGKEVSVLNGARRFINWLISTHTHYFYNTSFNIILPFTSQIFRVCYKRHPSHLTEHHAIKMYNLVYARNEIKKF